jgi:hypothetical protein
MSAFLFVCPLTEIRFDGTIFIYRAWAQGQAGNGLREAECGDMLLKIKPDSVHCRIHSFYFPNNLHNIVV